ncbi:MAG: hypothetical protein JW894_12990 [Bacteroidales bacterium]|nr:hypothetical protein [Bacteroidales bacterium]
MPLSDLFSYKITENSPEELSAELSLNIDHDIYKGHFPENPVTPGVCLVEITRQILSSVLKCELILRKAKDIKYRSAIIPPFGSGIIINIKYHKTDEGIETSCTISENYNIYTKLRGVFSEE